MRQGRILKGAHLCAAKVCVYAQLCAQVCRVGVRRVDGQSPFLSAHDPLTRPHHA